MVGASLRTLNALLERQVKESVLACSLAVDALPAIEVGLVSGANSDVWVHKQLPFLLSPDFL